MAPRSCPARSPPFLGTEGAADPASVSEDADTQRSARRRARVDRGLPCVWRRRDRAGRRASSAMMSKLSELLLIEAVRDYAAGLREHEISWRGVRPAGLVVPYRRPSLSPFFVCEPG